jgi:CBS domain-containing membrane protein
MAVLLGALAWLDFRRGGIFLVPPFAATMTILLYLPDVWIAQPFAIVFGSILGAAIGTVLSLFLGFGPGVAMMAVLTALITLPLLRAYHPPGVALAMYPPLLHPGLWFAIQVVLPFTLVAVISAARMSRLVHSWPQLSCTAPNRDRPNASLTAGGETGERWVGRIIRKRGSIGGFRIHENRPKKQSKRRLLFHPC